MRQQSNFYYLKFLPLIIFVISTIVAAVRLEGRVNAHDQLFNERKTQEVERWEVVQQQLKDMHQQLNRIEIKVENNHDRPFR